MNIIDKNLKFKNSLPHNNYPKNIILHHTECNGWTVERLHQLHLGNGWSGIGYHFYVRKDGSVYRGRPEWTIGAHCKGANTNTIGISFEGCYNDKDKTMPQVQFNAGMELIKYLKNKYGNMGIYGHREKGSSNCPGKYFPLDSFRNGKYQGSTTTSSSNNNNNSSNSIQECKDYVGGKCKELQQKLISLGYSCGSYGADGSFGQGTYNALVKFQKDNKLTVDGLAGTSTFTKLDELINKKNDSINKNNNKSEVKKMDIEALLKQLYSVECSINNKVAELDKVKADLITDLKAIQGMRDYINKNK